VMFTSSFQVSHNDYRDPTSFHCSLVIIIIIIVTVVVVVVVKQSISSLAANPELLGMMVSIYFHNRTASWLTLYVE
jgi:hypothetical protein